MIDGFFLIPQRLTSNGLPLDYRVERKPLDKRTRFYRNNNKWEISAWIAVNTANRLGLKIYDEEGAVSRILAPDAKTARAFYEHLQRFGFGKERA